MTYTGINEIQKMALPDFGLSFISVVLVFGVSLEAQTYLTGQPGLRERGGTVNARNVEGGST